MTEFEEKIREQVEAYEKELAEAEDTSSGLRATFPSRGRQGVVLRRVRGEMK